MSRISLLVGVAAGLVLTTAACSPKSESAVSGTVSDSASAPISEATPRDNAPNGCFALADESDLRGLSETVRAALNGSHPAVLSIAGPTQFRERRRAL